MNQWHVTREESTAVLGELGFFFFFFLLTSAKEVHLLFGWFVSRITQKTTDRISTELGWRMGLCPEQTPLTFGADPDEGILFPHLLEHCNTHFSTVLLTSQE